MKHQPLYILMRRLNTLLCGCTTIAQLQRIESLYKAITEERSNDSAMPNFSAAVSSFIKIQSDYISFRNNKVSLRTELAQFHKSLATHE